MNEIESNFDPIVKLLLDACAYEIEKINIEMEASQSRIIEKLVEVILPDVVIGMKPSTAILHARPVESDVSTKDLQFKIEKKIDQNQTNTQSIHFGYIGQFKLVDAELLYIAASKRLFKIHNYWQKETLYSDGAIKPNTSNELFLGIKINDNIKTK